MKVQFIYNPAETADYIAVLRNLTMLYPDGVKIQDRASTTADYVTMCFIDTQYSMEKRLEKRRQNKTKSASTGPVRRDS